MYKYYLEYVLHIELTMQMKKYSKVKKKVSKDNKTRWMEN